MTVVQRAEKAVEHDDLEEGEVERKKAQAKCHALHIEEQFWSPKPRVKWLRSGDRNSKFFHAIVRQRRVQGMIHKIKNFNDVWVLRPFFGTFGVCFRYVVPYSSYDFGGG